MKKKISLVTIVSVCLGALLLALALFEIVELGGFVGKLAWTLLVIAVSGILSLNSCEMLERKNKLALVSMSLIGLSALFVIICIWTSLSSKEVFTQITAILSIASVCFNLIVAGILKLGKNYLPIQIGAGVAYTGVSVYIASLFFSSISLFNDGGWKFFVLFLLLSLVGFFVTIVLSKKQLSTESVVSEKFVKITKVEYEELIACKKELESLKNND